MSIFFRSLQLCLLFAGICWAQFTTEVVTNKVVNSTDPKAALDYSGSWVANCSGRAMATNTPGDRVIFQFTGGQLSLILGLVDPSAVNVQIDGADAPLIVAGNTPSADGCDPILMTPIQTPPLKSTITHTVILTLSKSVTLSIFSFNFQVDSRQLVQPTKVGANPPDPTTPTTLPPYREPPVDWSSDWSPSSTTTINLPTGTPDTPLPTVSPAPISTGAIAGIVIAVIALIATGILTIVFRHRIFCYSYKPVEEEGITTEIRASHLPLPSPFIITRFRTSIGPSSPPPVARKDRSGPEPSGTRRPESSLPTYSTRANLHETSDSQPVAGESDARHERAAVREPKG